MAPSGSNPAAKGKAVVVVDVGRDGVGRDNGFAHTSSRVSRLGYRYRVRMHRISSGGIMRGVLWSVGKPWGKVDRVGGDQFVSRREQGTGTPGARRALEPYR